MNKMSWWYFPAQNGNKSTTLLIWMQGVPGGSSLFGLFVENGPLQLDANFDVTLRNYTWNK